MMEVQSTVFGIVDRLATSVAAVQWSLYRTAPDGRIENRVKVQRHPALSVWRKPNKFATGEEFREATIQHYELTGEWWWTLGRSQALPDAPPLEMWLVRPDRMEVVKHPAKFLTGYMYSNGKDDVPLRLEDVIMNRRPNPADPYRGIGPLGSLILDIDGDAAASEYNLNFFRNGAEPGGMIRTKATLSDPEFEELLKRWRQSHRGVSNAHAVGVLEGGAEWEERSYSMRDMQFEQLRRFSREQIRNAWGFPKALLGDVEDVNRANAEAATVVFANWLVVPRLNRMRASLNDDLLPLYGTKLGQGYEFDYDSPTPPDKVDEREDMTARVGAVVALAAAGYDKEDLLEAYELPEVGIATNPVVD